MTGPLPLRVTSELVAVAWIASIPGFTTDMVGTQLPPVADGDQPAPWIATRTGFVTVAVVGGTPDPMLPVRRPVLQVDTWASIPGSNKPPWGVAVRLAELIILAALDRVTVPRLLDVRLNDAVYPPASVQAAYPVSEPRRLYDDAGDMARYQLDLQLIWRPIADVLP